VPPPRRSDECHQARRSRRSQLDARLCGSWCADRVDYPQCLGRPSGSGEQRGSPDVDRGDLLGIRETLPRRRVHGKSAVEVASTIETSRRESSRQGGSLRIAEQLVPHFGDDALDLVVVALHGVGLGQHFGAFTRLDSVVGGDSADQTHSESRVPTDERQAGGPQQLHPGNQTTRVDPPQGHLHHVLTSS
jgi:hypothetical protein